MNYIYIGVPYQLELLPEEGTSFAAAPYAVLYHPTSRSYYVATVSGPDSEGNCLAVFDTTGMPTGSYTLEIYDSSSMQAVMLREINHATAVEVAASIIIEQS